MNLADIATIVLGACLILAASTLANISASTRWRRVGKAVFLAAVAFLGVLLFGAKLAHAADPLPAVVMVAKPPNGALIQLHDVAGPCIAPARLATYVAPDRKSIVPGCFKVSEDGSMVGLSWLDGDQNVLRTTVFRPPKAL